MTTTETVRAAKPRSAKELKDAKKYFIVYTGKDAQDPTPYLDRNVAEAALAGLDVAADLVESADGKNPFGKVLASSVPGQKREPAARKGGKAAVAMASAKMDKVKADPKERISKARATAKAAGLPWEGESTATPAKAAPKSTQASTKEKAPRHRSGWGDASKIKVLSDHTARPGTVRALLLDAVLGCKTVGEALAKEITRPDKVKMQVRTLDIRFAEEQGYISVQ